MNYSFSVDEAAGQVDDIGNFHAGTTAGIYGEAIAVEVAQGSASKRATASVTLESGPLDRLVISPRPAYIPAWLEQPFLAVAADRHGNKISEPTVIWSVEYGGGSIDRTGRFRGWTEPGTNPRIVRATVTQAGVRRSTTVSFNVTAFESTRIYSGTETSSMWLSRFSGEFSIGVIELRLEQVGSLVKGYLQILYPHFGSGELTGTIEGNRIVFSVPGYFRGPFVAEYAGTLTRDQTTFEGEYIARNFRGEITDTGIWRVSERFLP